MFHNTKDNQVVNLEFANGATATFTMIAFSEEVCVRKTRIFGTHGELTGNGRTIKVFDFRTLKKEKMVPTIPNIKTKMTGHFMGDYRLMEAFVEAVAFNDPSRIKTGPEETLESHLIVFQAEKSRKQNQILSCDW
jgi:predicted dehydrogenase